MKALECHFALAVSCGALLAADANQSQAIVQAAQNLEQQASYGWISTSRSAPETMSWRQGPTEGKTMKDGCSYVSFTLGSNTISMGFKGTNAAINWADQWRSAQELQGDYAWIGDRLNTYKLPAQEAEFLATNTLRWAETEAGTLGGELNDAALKWLLSRGRRQFTELPDIKGSVKFWLQNGSLTKYEYRIQGTLPLDPDQTKAPMDRTTTVEIQNVGATTVALPPEAEEKLK